MGQKTENLKNKMREFTRLFTIEVGVFDKLVIIYKYFRLLDTNPLAKDILQKIFDDTIKLQGIIENEFQDKEDFFDIDGEAIFTRDFWLYYANMENIHRRMKKLKDCKLSDREEYEDLCRLFSKPYSDDMLELSFKVINSKVFEKISHEDFIEEDENEKIHFDEKRSVLHVKGMRVKISKQDKITNAHKILKYILVSNNDNLEDDFYYSEIAFDEFGDLEYSKDPKAWERYHDACKYINKIVQDQTDGKVEDLLIYNTGKQGRVRLNKKFI